MRTAIFASLLSAAVWAVAVHAELPPGSYDSLRAEAPEALIIEVVGVRSAPKPSNSTEVVARARVLHVERTKAGLKSGAMIEIRYTRPNASIPGPRPIPVLSEKSVSPAFLRKGEGKEFEPAAYGMSFIMTPEPRR